MSNELAIATVTAALSELLRPAVQSEVQGADVTMVRPDELVDLDAPGVNIFLYQVSPNPAYRNADLPLRGSTSGRLVERPQAALDLHYLLTFYGDEASLEPQRVMGSVVRVLHSRPALTPDLIQTTVSSLSFPFLAGSDLAEQIERVKFTPIVLNLEELSKFWSMFSQTAYRLSMAYIGNLVLIETDESPLQGLPVRTRNIYVRPFRQPVVEKVGTTDQSPATITSASTVIVEGKQLRGDITRVSIGAAQYTPAGADLGDTRIRIDLATEPPASGDLRAGLQGLQVIHRLLLGTPPTEHEGVESNVMPLLLRPTIRQTAPPAYDLQLSPVQTDPHGNAFRTVTVTLDPEVGARQRVVLILNEFGNATDPAGFSFLADLRTVAGNVVTFTIPDTVLNAGDFIVRVQADGAQSLPERDPVAVDPITLAPNPTFNQYIAPRLIFP
jgi:hypothetical protein